MNVPTENGRVRASLLPNYDELTLYLISTSLLLTLVFDATYRGTLFKLFSHSPQWELVPLYCIALVFLYAGLLPIRHANKAIRKTNSEKRMMLYFAVLTNAGVGILATAYIALTAVSYQLVFPVWNMVNSVLLMLAFYGGLMNERHVADENVPGPHLVLGTFGLIAVILACIHLLRLHWSLTLSVCLSYACYISGILRVLVPSVGDAIVER